MYFICQQYNKLPTANSVLDEDPYLFYAMDNAIAGYRFSEKKLKDYSEDDKRLSRMIKISTMIANSVELSYFKRQLNLMCRGDVFNGDDLNIERLKEVGLESSIDEIRRHANL